MLLIFALLLTATPAHADKTCRGPIISPRFAALYETNDILPQDLPLAAKLYRESAESGSREAQYKLGTFYATGRGLRRNDIEAYYWLSLAADDDGEYKLPPKYLAAKIEARKKLTEKQAASVDKKSQAWPYFWDCDARQDGDDTLDVEGTAKDIKSRLPSAEKGDSEASSLLTVSYWQLKNDKMAYFWRGITLKSANCIGKCVYFRRMIQYMRLETLSKADKAVLDKEIAAWHPRK